jgi:glycosyltransferase involved in cell wall biosynthesis
MNREEAAAFYCRADYLLIPSRIESIPVVFSDAMQAGCPVIAMPVGDLPRLVAQYGVGVAASAVTPEAFADAIRAAVRTSPGVFQKGLLRAAQSFDIEQIVKQFLDQTGIDVS